MIIPVGVSSNLDNWIIAGAMVIAILAFIVYLARGNMAKGKKADRLVGDGDCYDAEIVAVIYTSHKASGKRCLPDNVECVYTDRYGHTYTAYSDWLIYNSRSRKWSHKYIDINKQHLTAKIYVSSVNPDDYYIEVAVVDGAFDPRYNFNWELKHTVKRSYYIVESKIGDSMNVTHADKIHFDEDYR